MSQRKAPRGSVKPAVRGRARVVGETSNGAPAGAGEQRRARDEREPTAGERIRVAREARGWSQRLLSRLVAREDGQSPGAWQVAISEYESGKVEPTPERVALLLSVLGADAESRARAALADALPAALMTVMIREHGADAVERALLSQVSLVRMLAPVSARDRGHD